jgi:hypothetical protein
MNLLNLIQSQISSQTVGQISNTIGESPEGTKSALGVAFPALLGSLVGKANASPSGATDIFNMIKQGQSQGGGWAESISNAMTGATGAAPGGQSLLNSLLGSKLGPVADFIASKCGIRGSSATSLLGMAGPFLMGIIGKQVTSQGLGASGLGQLLGSQTQFLKDAIPSGLANTLGIGSLLSGAQDTQRVETAAGYSRPAEPSYSRPAEAVHRGEAYGRPVETEPRASGSNILKWAWVPLVLALGGWFIAHRNSQNSEMGGTSEPVRREVGTVRNWKAPDFSSLNLTPGSPADNIAKSITAGDWVKPIDLEGLNFDSTGGLEEAGKAKIQEVGKVLSTAGVKARVTGFGDTEEAGLARAESIKSTLTSSGVPEERITTRGRAGAGMPTINVLQP